MTPRFIDLYYEWMEKGLLPSKGLCKSLPPSSVEIFERLEPTMEDFCTLAKEGLPNAFWGYGLPTKGSDTFQRAYTFTPLRECIILFCAAINNEL